MSETLAVIIEGQNKTQAAFASMQQSQQAMVRQTQASSSALQSASSQMSSSFETSTKKAGAFADTVGRTATTLARSADSFGLPIGPLRALDDAMDVAELGFNNLAKSTAGFNAASVGVAGAGLAVGAAIGAWLNTFPAVRKAVDGLRDSLLSLLNVQTASAKMAAAMAGMADFQAQMGKSNEEAVKRQIESMKRGGASMEQILAVYGKAKPVLTGAKKVIEDLAESHKKAEVATKAHAEAAKRLQEEFDKGTAEATAKHYQKIADEAEKAYQNLLKGFSRTIAKLDEEMAAGIHKANAARIAEMAGLLGGETSMGLLWERFGRQATLFAGKAGTPAGESFSKSFGKIMEGLPNVILGAIQGGGNVFAAIGASIGGDIGASLGKKLSESIGGSLGKMLGSLGGPLGSLLGGAVGGLIGKLFGSEGKETNKLRDTFIAAAGGLHELNVKAQQAGTTLTALLAAKDKAGLQSAIDGLNAAFGVTDQATQKLQAAMQQYGITVGEMGPKFAQQELDKQALSLLESYKLLTGAGADHNLVIEKMGPSMVEYVNQSRSAGVSIPEDMRKVVEELLAQGKILDENGNAFQTAEEAGITFGASLQDSMSKAAEQMMRLVDAIERLYGLGEINIPVRVHPDVTGPGGENRHAEHFPAGGMVTGWGVPSMLHGTPSAPEYALPHAKLTQLVQGAITAALAANGGSQPAHISMGPTYLDGAVVARGVTRRQDMGYGRHKRRTRRS